MFTGARGAVSWAKLTHEVTKLETELKGLQEENSFLENKINLLRDNNLDLDLLQEQAMSILGYANPDDMVILLPRE
ncbi:MAG: septum formation initiator family protein [Alphaproteobacteria bacterium]|nr:septum formation initiator family protein [Alphaproteobacteria bacterium]